MTVCCALTRAGAGHFRGKAVLRPSAYFDGSHGQRRSDRKAFPDAARRCAAGSQTPIVLDGSLELHSQKFTGDDFKKRHQIHKRPVPKSPDLLRACGA